MNLPLYAALAWVVLALARAALAHAVRHRLPARVTTSMFFPLMTPWRLRLRLPNVAMDARIRIRRESIPEKWGLLRVKPNRENWHTDRNDIRFRDFAFDDRIDVRGPRDESVSLLSYEARRILLRLFDVERGRLRKGTLTCDVLLVRGLGGGMERAKDVARLAEILEERTRLGVRACLAEMALKDEFESVRLVATGYLKEAFPDAPEVAEASRVAAEEGHELWYRVGGLGGLPEAEKLPRWRAILESEKEGPFMRALALNEVAQRIPAAEAEEVCLAHLQRRNPEITLEALRLLGAQFGTVRALPAMGSFSDWDVTAYESMTLGKNIHVGEFAKTAIVALRSRLGLDGEDAGRLALAPDGTQGALSTPPVEGALSLPTPTRTK